MRFDIITLFPEMVIGASGYGVTGKAIQSGLVSLKAWNPRDYTVDKYRTVDDRPYGGGPGMVMKYQPLFDTVNAIKAEQKNKKLKVVYLSPQGRPISQSLLTQASELEQLILIAGRYEGIDERFVQQVCDEEWSLGDYVISGGELAALIVVDGITRLLPGVLGDEESAKQDSHMDGLLDFPHYTRPEKIDEDSVPAVLLSGNHADIERWRTKQALGRTWLKRPDLLKNKPLDEMQRKLLEEFIVELNNLRCGNE
ncbi:MAG: tRNA (guanosine(37)-N1)-methyltransferase TrmD [Methylicorpusculum sp.]|uniref:tRNA (guanosine(37)-N1)-methyltransferase TrmD n=1 Tax=Methylicorpusculum sp. TaxID=2713644 RepID=UPI00271C1588|nr:tRNA (guanosine(37)-N1)-methyltransferase TrmD [Methylicorpusculum sp.]MDO8845559.1 tRNA (guanosine(37)-N1)-methyltransferase TrmD [Methylicorpusculum sp.]MDO8938946.1 tRNA (guanosine(37)-N1)-methyltransferase TrmD [Methylicorpusculum sp.]MDP2200510.1 tRNA (guanosine(37)-N1)-methyltransferase TrmD [Methylicorpusculum sp.]